MHAIVLATRNRGKIAELTALLQEFSLNIIGLDSYPELEDIPETGETFEENARIKARAVCEHTGLVAVADDSGLEVDALGGAPGVYSARYSADGGQPATDARNNEKLLAALRGVPREERGARFRCVMVAAAPNGAELSADGAWEGLIAEEPRGENGFGYDPLFFDPELGRHSAQLSQAEKNARSHRGRALRNLLTAWPDFWAKTNPE